MEEEGVVELHAVVRGHVQGVFFRVITRDCATRLGLKGTVKNLPDGTVEIYAQGSKNRLDEMINSLKGDRGPGYIEEVITDYSQPTHFYDSFRIIY